MHTSVMQFGQRHLVEEVCKDADVLEVGAQNVNGSLRGHVETHGPRSYWGIDMQPGVGVDEVTTVEKFVIDNERVAGKLTEARNMYDLVVCTEMLEHAQDWRGALASITMLTRMGGYLLLTTRSPGFPRHAFPDDYWRFELNMLYNHMVHLGFVAVEACPDPDPKSPGVLMFLHRVAYIGELREPTMLEPHKVP
jgi:2-polyprenyl-3-methyl-5-hydroxy-6-metoxy-1,4-benzoquinol methylase